MKRKPDELIVPTLFESALVWDEKLGDWTVAWGRIYKRRRTVTFIDVVTFDAVTTSKTSDSFYCAPYADFLLLLDLNVANSPTDITIDIEFSDNNEDWYKLMNGPFGSLMYEDSAGDKDECLYGKVLGEYIRVKATATGTSASNTFILQAKIIFSG